MSEESTAGMQQLAGQCSLCNEGYHPNLEIEISDEPMESSITGELEYRWMHVQCKRDHDRTLLAAFGDD